MPRRREHSPYQLPLEFGAHTSQDTAVYRAVLQSLASTHEGNRFVREVRDEIVIRRPTDAADYLRQKIFVPFERFDQEELWLLLLSARNRITHEVMLYRGTVDSIPIRPAEVFKEAIRVNAAGILLAHNHPSGECSPSPQDVTFTETANRAGIQLGITVHDHIVVGERSWASLRELGLGFASQVK